MAVLVDASTMDSVDSALRLSGLIFPSDRPVLGKNNADLMLALGAINPQRHRANEQIAVVRRLCVLFEAAIRTYSDSLAIDLNSDRLVVDLNSDGFYNDILRSIYDEHHEMCKYLTTSSLRLALEIYVKAFARSGWKRIRKNTDTIMPYNDEYSEDCLEILEPIQPVADRVKLERLVKEWMIIRGNARRAGITDNNHVFHLFKDVEFPRQSPDETLNAYMLRLQLTFRLLNQARHSETDMISYVAEQRGERMDRVFEQNERLEKISDQRLQRIDEQSREIEEYKGRLRNMRKDVDERADLRDDCDKLVGVLNELNDKLTEATEMQARIMEFEIDAAYGQDDTNDKLHEVVRGQKEIRDTQNEVGQEVRRNTLTQGSVADGQDGVTRRQTELMAMQTAVMESLAPYGLYPIFVWDNLYEIISYVAAS
ncbi:hypothetical protein KVR01_007785 [Diaporthe batatas]|uniref:uncharacterized protein n=1 Tax=Diaporthe batatas TaxID=748121 RepID=UPI001D059E7D|nr:uncharacterized protein KVR01_007785 [Diaporthe batatas]KAG8162020.1 hypothetical protein KVR01_007785 [Diaporthe batatas]